MSGMYELRANAAYIMLNNPFDTTTVPNSKYATAMPVAFHIRGLCLNWRGLSLLPIPWMDCCFHCLWAMPRCGGFKQVPETSRLPWRCPQRPWSMAICFFFSPTMWMCFFLFCSKGGKWTTFNRGDGKDGSKRAFWRTTKPSCGWWVWFPHFFVCSYMSRKTFSAVLEKVGMGWKFDTGHTGLSGLSFLVFRWISSSLYLVLRKWCLSSWKICICIPSRLRVWFRSMTGAFDSTEETIKMMDTHFNLTQVSV